MNSHRILAIDAGMGTADILVHEPDTRPENAVKLVVPSRTVIVARQIATATRRARTVVFAGPTMGGGPCGGAMRAHVAAGRDFLATEPAALTFADDLDKVAGCGVRIVDEAEARRAVRGGALEIRSGDIDLDALLPALGRLGVETRFDGAAVAAQDHGYAPRGSNRALRFALWERTLAARPLLEELFWEARAIPAELTRLRAAAGCLAGLATAGGGAPELPVLAGDTGPAALLGALPDGCRDAVLVNVGNGHTICAVALDGRLTGVFEHHTRAFDGSRLETALRRFLAGDLDNAEVFADGGHGALLAESVPGGLRMLVTGPNRDLLQASSLPLEFAAPHGDMMLTGAFGLVRAYQARFPA